MKSLDEITREIAAIKKQGYVKSQRRGPTGVGYTLESLLGLEENNISDPDFGEIELKGRRENQGGMITLFTFNRKAWKIKPLEAIRAYGSYDEKNDREGMYYTMELGKLNSAGLFLSVIDDAISLKSSDGVLIAEWELNEVVKRFNSKVKNMLLVEALVEERGGIEHFYYHRARIMYGEFSKSIIKSQFEAGRVKLDLRLHDKGTSARNHGTGFRVDVRDITEFFSEIREIKL